MEYFNYSLGKFETKIMGTCSYQGSAVINYTGKEVFYTRVLEYKHFEFETQEKIVVTFEYSSDYKEDWGKYYPINDEKGKQLVAKYQELTT